MISFSILLLIGLVMAHIMMGLFVLLKDPKNQTNRSFFYVVIIMVAWIAANYFSNLSNLSSEQLLFFNRAVFVFPALEAAAVLLFALCFTGVYQRLPFLVKSLIVVSAIGAVGISLTRVVVASVGPIQNGIVGVVFGSLTPIYFTYETLMFGPVVPLLTWAYRKSNGAQRARIQFIAAGVAATFIIIFITNLIAPTLFHTYALVPTSPYATLIMVASITVAILRHRLFDLKLAVARSVAYVLLLGTLGMFYALILLGITSIFFRAGAYNDPIILESGLAVVMAFAFQPLRRFFERITNSIFYREHYDSQEVLNNFSKILVSELDLDRILKRSLEALTQSLHIQYAQVVVFNADRVYRLAHVGPLPQRLMVAPELAKLGHPMIIADELDGGERKAILEGHGIRVSMTLRTTEEFVGYLLLGDKLSGDIYSTQDVRLLEIIGKQLAVAVLNAKSYAEIQAFNLTLQARVDHATNRLRVANRHLKELDHAKDEFISMASHQLRTPLTTIKGYLSMLQEGDAGQLSASQRDFVDYAFGASERMVNLISDLLNVSRLSAGRFLIQAKPVDMVQMVADEVRQLQSHAAAKNLNLIFVKPDGVFPAVELDDNKTRQVVMNFIDNAIYYTQEGEVRVVLEPAGLDRIRLEVRDTGIGVPKSAQRKLFSKFFRAENAQIVRPDGTGLGLYLAKRVVEDQGGEIIFSSVEGKGSTFGFELPRKPQPPVKTGKPHHVHS